MAIIESSNVVGAFRSCQQDGHEFQADIVLPYRQEYDKIPILGQFIMVELQNSSEAVLGRIIASQARGKLVDPNGDDYLVRMVSEGTPIPDNIKQDHLRYHIKIRVLGLLREKDSKVHFIPSQRRMPHVGSRVAFLSQRILKEVTGASSNGSEIGFLAFGDFVYAGGDERCIANEWIIRLPDSVLVKFPIDEINGKKTFVFAKAGFGKSNLVKILVSMLYERPPTTRRNGRQVPVSTLIFDPEGEYFWPDDKGRPGLCDVPHLKDRLVVFTDRNTKSDFYRSFVAGRVKLDIRNFKAGDITSLALPKEKQDQQNVVKISHLSDDAWIKVVDLIHKQGNNADIEELSAILRLDPGQEIEARSARANLTTIVRMLHDPTSQLFEKITAALIKGAVCVVDISLLKGKVPLILSGLILRNIFERNQRQFTETDSKSIACNALIEEAQSVLRQKDDADEPYVEWVKEGRKYDLGAILVTQQPGSIPKELLSQADNFFVAHLLAEVDLWALKAANGAFSDDLLMLLANETIPGNILMWSNNGRSYPLPMRAFSFEKMYSVIDPDSKKASVETMASEIVEASVSMEPVLDGPDKAFSEQDDVMQQAIQVTMQRIAAMPGYLEQFIDGKPWADLFVKIKNNLPEAYAGRAEEMAKMLTKVALDRFFGKEGTGWKTDKRPRKNTNGNGRSDVLWVTSLIAPNRNMT